MSKKEELDYSNSPPPEDLQAPPLDATEKGIWERVWPILATGAGLFSDGYLQGVIGCVGTMLNEIYPKRYKAAPAYRLVAPIAFAGTVVGQLGFGVLSDYWSRKWSLVVSTSIMILFAALAAGSYGAHDSLNGMVAALAAYRFLIGIGIGGEYPAGSVGAAESSGEVKKGQRNRWFVLFTNVQIDLGFVVANLVPTILVLIFSERHLRAAWRLALGLGVIPPLSLFYLRLKYTEPEEYKRQKMNRYPYWLIIKFYWWRLLIVSIIWFIYDFSAYSFSIYSTSWLTIILGDSAPLWKTFAWGTLINFFYVPGALIGAFVSDWVGPRYTLAAGVFAQGIVGFIMSGLYAQLDTPHAVAGFVVVYGIFLSLGEIGPGDNIGLVASKTSATAVRGQYYGIAAATGKIGAFIGTYIYPSIIADAGSDTVKQGQYPFFVASSLCIFSAFLAIFLLPHIGQDTIEEEDLRFRAYLDSQGFDTSTMGTKEYQEYRRSSVAPAL